MTEPLPTLSIHLEVRPTNPPRPVGLVVRDGAKTVGLLAMDDVRAVAAQIEALMPHSDDLRGRVETLERIIVAMCGGQPYQIVLDDQGRPQMASGPVDSPAP